MANRRWKDQDWFIVTPDGKQYESTNQAMHLAVLMDIRDELKIVRQRLLVLECRHFLDIPKKLDRIERNTKKRKPKAVGRPKLRVVA